VHNRFDRRWSEADQNRVEYSAIDGLRDVVKSRRVERTVLQWRRCQSALCNLAKTLRRQRQKPLNNLLFPYRKVSCVTAYSLLYQHYDE